ncbi:MAG TPA: glycosyltransferase, partial [Tepidisphaeraceae bacterium]|nr:glycosyltransferase [Tepidisphaeraceae bacterium]
YGRMLLPLQYGYPADRFCPARMGVNERRFSNEPISPSDLQRFACEVSYVSHATETAESILQTQLTKQISDSDRRLLIGTFEQMKAHYAGGGDVLCVRWIRRMFEKSLVDCRVMVDPSCIGPIVDFFAQRINNAMFRHQSLKWCAELGVDLHLWGRGWEKHPMLSKFAKGTADNVAQLRAIYQASKINLQVTPFGAVHQRLLDGLMSGGFFLIRNNRGDRLGQPHKTLWNWCQRNGIQNDSQLNSAIDDEIRPTIEQINWLEAHRWGKRDFPLLYDTCRAHAETDFMSSADSIWPGEYDAIAFETKDELQKKLHLFMNDESRRQQIAASMRQRVLSTMTYTAISQRMLTMIGDQLEQISQQIRSAA